MLDGVNATPSDLSQTTSRDPTQVGDSTRRNLIEEADNSYENEDVVFKEHGNTLKDSYKEKNAVNMLLKPISPLAASATVVNLLLATGPFS